MGTKKKVFIPLAVTIILVLGFVIAWTYISRNDYVIKVNGQKIAMNEFEPYLKIQKKAMEMQAGENVWDMLINEAPAIETARENAKQIMINAAIKTQQAKKRKISLTSEEKEEIREYANQYEDALKEYDLTAEEFAKMNEDVLIESKLGIALYKEQDHSSHSHGKIDIESYEKGEESPLGKTTFNSRHILFSTKGLSEEEAESVRIKAEGVLERIKNGEDFATLAKQYSEDPGSKDNGGLYENIERGMFVTEYEDAVLSIKEGEIYPTLVESAHGYHIIKSEGVTNPDGVLSLEVAEIVLENELDEAYEKWLSEAEIDINQQRYNSAQ